MGEQEPESVPQGGLLSTVHQPEKLLSQMPHTFMHLYMYLYLYLYWYLYLFTRRKVISSIGEWGRKWVEGEWAHAILTFTHAKYTFAHIHLLMIDIQASYIYAC